MKIAQGTIYFPRLFSEAQCPVCARILEWEQTEVKNQAKARCCNKIFTATLNYVGITIEDVKDQKEISNIDKKEEL